LESSRSIPQSVIRAPHSTVAVVTGAASGIGKAIALTLGLHGKTGTVPFSVSEKRDCPSVFPMAIAVCDVNLEGAQAVARELTATGAKAQAYKFDVGSLAEAEAAAGRICADLGPIRVLVNNAGIARDNLLLRMSEEDFDRVLNVNLKGAFNMTKACMRPMLKARWGRIVNIASIIGQMGNAGQANYAAAKAGLIGLTKSTAKELAGRNITVNAIAPGFIATPMTEKLPPDVQERYRVAIPLQRFGTPEDVARVCLFLVSDAAAYITGQVIRVDGGLLM